MTPIVIGGILLAFVIILMPAVAIKADGSVAPIVVPLAILALVGALLLYGGAEDLGKEKGAILAHQGELVVTELPDGTFAVTKPRGQ